VARKPTQKRKAIDLFHSAANVATKTVHLSFPPESATRSSARRWNSPGNREWKFNGVLCGRATWKDGIPIYAKQGAVAFRKWLETEGREEHQQRERQTEGRTSWHSIYGVEPSVYETRGVLSI